MIYYDIEKDIEIDFCPQKMPKKVYIQCAFNTHTSKH